MTINLRNLKKLSLTIVATMAAVIISGPLALAAPFVAITDVASYTGSVTSYATLADAQSGTNALGTYAIPDRVTAAPSNTPFRDAAIYTVNDYAPEGSDINILMTAWYYTTVAGNPQSGLGNPNNTNTGFVQLYDDGSDTVTTSSGIFSNLQSGVYTDFHLQVTGANAGATEFARLWPAATNGAPASTSGGVFHSYELDVLFSGLDGQEVSPGIYRSELDPTSVNGSFNAIFENTSAGHTGFYTVEFTFGLDNWAVAQSALGNLNGDVSGSVFVGTVPEPSTVALLGIAGVAGLAMVRRRRQG